MLGINTLRFKCVSVCLCVTEVESLGDGTTVVSVTFVLIIESVDSVCKGSADTQYMLIPKNFSKSPKQLTYKLL